MRQYRVCMFAGSKVRLQTRVGDAPMAWRFDLMDGDVRDRLVIRDEIDSQNGLDVHRGLILEVDVYAPSEEEGRAKAVGLAAVHLTALSISTRAPIDTPQVVLSYEITPGKEADLDFIQFDNVELPLGKVPGSAHTVLEIQQALLGIPDPTRRQPVLLAGQLYAAALRELEPVIRFMLLWPACEALDRPLRRLWPDHSPKDRHWGLKALAVRCDEASDLIDGAYDLRTNLFHAKAGVLDTLVERATDAADRLETIIATGLLAALDLSDIERDLPDVSSSNHPITLTHRGRLRRKHGAWADDAKPHLETVFELRGLGEPGKAEFSGSFKLVNADALDAPKIEMNGPQGPNLGQVELSAGLIIRADGSTEPVTPDAAE